MDIANDAFGSNLQLTANHVALLEGPGDQDSAQEAA
jgi:hypothetical protein